MRLFHVLALGKYDSTEYPYTVANEKIASDLGRALGLRVPEVQLYRFRNQWHAFQHYLEQTASEETTPPGTSRQIAAYFDARPELLHGMVCFDLFVCNNDRRPENLLFAQDGHVWLVDHGNALFYRPTQGQPAGVARLNRVQRNLRALFDKPHHFLRAVQSTELMENWCDRIAALPDYTR